MREIWTGKRVARRRQPENTGDTSPMRVTWQVGPMMVFVCSPEFFHGIAHLSKPLRCNDFQNLLRCIPCGFIPQIPH